MPWMDSQDLTAASVEPPAIIEAAEEFRRLVMRYFPKSRPDMEAGAFLELVAGNGKRIRVSLGILKGAAA